MDCHCNKCIWQAADAMADALEAGYLVPTYNGASDEIAGLMLTPQGRSYNMRQSRQRAAKDFCSKV